MNIGKKKKKNYHGDGINGLQHQEFEPSGTKGEPWRKKLKLGVNWGGEDSILRIGYGHIRGVCLIEVLLMGAITGGGERI